MKQQPLKIGSRIVLLMSALALCSVLFFPIWRIDLDAPQYPEGLNLLIHANGIKGNVDIINGLNHYIGMKTLHDKDFIEFTLLPYIIGGFALLFLFTSILNQKKILYFSFGLFVAFGIIAMIDFWRWEYNYGHNLDPNAAIIVPGMAYQPPLIGFKQLLNFGAYSIPDVGGWLFIAVGLVLLLAVIFEWKKSKVKPGILNGLLLIVLPLLLNSCTTQPEPIVAGKDHCHFCKMTITDTRFGAELVTPKGKLYKFDDLHCLTRFYKSGEVKANEKNQLYVANYEQPAEFIDATKAFYLKAESIHSPMNGNVAAFASAERQAQYKQSSNGTFTNWASIQP
ncbi:MAG: hypothetical protein RLY16_1721 [Bacteroidota bacterium]|jgi:copper chaperone NosL